jgi:hypothetical protein
MSRIDEWERDPSVKRMRRVFARMEERQNELLSAVGIDPHDPRLRGWREKALPHFERCWRIGAGRGLKLSEERTAAVYLHCLAAQMTPDGVRVDPDVLPGDPEIESLVKEAAG